MVVKILFAIRMFDLETSPNNDSVLDLPSNQAAVPCS
jgi:hypothetical protein